MKYISYIILFVLICANAYAPSSSSSINWLSRNYADTLYCQLNGDCTLRNLFLTGNASFIGSVFNITIINQNITGMLTVWGNVTAQNFFGNFVGNGTGMTGVLLRDGSTNLTGDWDYGSKGIQGTGDVDIGGTGAGILYVIDSGDYAKFLDAGGGLGLEVDVSTAGSLSGGKFTDGTYEATLADGFAQSSAGQIGAVVATRDGGSSWVNLGDGTNNNAFTASDGTDIVAMFDGTDPFSITSGGTAMNINGFEVSNAGALSHDTTALIIEDDMQLDGNSITDISDIEASGDIEIQSDTGKFCSGNSPNDICWWYDGSQFHINQEIGSSTLNFSHFNSYRFDDTINLSGIVGSTIKAMVLFSDKEVGSSEATGPYPSGLNKIGTQEFFNMVGTSDATTIFGGGVTDDAYRRFKIKTTGQMEWGSGAAATDVTLYRSAANTLSLATGDGLFIGGTLGVTGLATFSGNARISGTDHLEFTSSGDEYIYSPQAGKIAQVQRGAAHILTDSNNNDIANSVMFEIEEGSATVGSGTSLFKIDKEGDINISKGDLYVAEQVGIGTPPEAGALVLKGTAATNILTIRNSANNQAFVIDNSNLRAQFYGGSSITNAVVTFYGALAGQYGMGYNNLRTSIIAGGNAVIIAGKDYVEIAGNLSVNNTLNVTKDLNVEGNITGNLIYGEMWFHQHVSGVTSVINTIGVAVNVSGFTGASETGQDLNGFGYDSANEWLNCRVAGKYDSSYQLSFGNAGNNDEYMIRLAVNGVGFNKTASHRKIGANGDVGNTAGFGALNLSINDNVSMQIIGVDSSVNILSHSGSVALLRIGN